MSNPRGSAWGKWDLHVHTPDSLIHSYGGADAWDKFIDALSKLPPEFKVLGINDYIFLDGYKKVVAAKEAWKLPNIDLLLPIIEKCITISNDSFLHTGVYVGYSEERGGTDNDYPENSDE